MNKTIVTVSRKWHEPQIKTTVSDSEICIEMPLEDFRKALIVEIGSVAWIFKQKTFEEQVNAAFQAVVSGIKKETAKVMAQVVK